MSGPTFFDAMQWWNDELQTSHLRQINQSLNANLQTLRQAQAQSSHEQRAQSQQAEAAKHFIFSAHKLLDEAQEQLDEQPNKSLFLYIKVIEALYHVTDEDFTDLSDKEYFFKVSKTYKSLGEELKKVFGNDYIYHLQNEMESHTLYRYLHNIALVKEVLDYVENGGHKGFFGVNKNRLKDGIRAIGRERNRLSAVQPFCRQIDRDGPETFSRNLSKSLDRLFDDSCKNDHYGLVDREMLEAIHPSNMHMFIDPLELVSQEIQKKDREYLGLETPPFGHDFFDSKD